MSTEEKVPRIETWFGRIGKGWDIAGGTKNGETKDVTP